MDSNNLAIRGSIGVKLSAIYEWPNFNTEVTEKVFHTVGAVPSSREHPEQQGNRHIFFLGNTIISLYL